MKRRKKREGVCDLLLEMEMVLVLRRVIGSVMSHLEKRHLHMETVTVSSSKPHTSKTVPPTEKA